jgi:hypothetical protein
MAKIKKWAFDSLQAFSKEVRLIEIALHRQRGNSLKNTSEKGPF